MKSFALIAALAWITGVAASGGPKWGYDGIYGPAYWGGLDPSFSKCNQGRQQSPINLGQTTDEITYGGDQKPHNLSYAWAPLTKVVAQHNGHTIQVDLPSAAQAANSLTFDGKRYQLVQFHLHAPSEHRLNSRSFDAELHLVSKAADGQLLVTGILLDAVAVGGTNLLDGIVQKLPIRTGGKIAVPRIDLPAILSAVRNLNQRWLYRGSLTTPPCLEGVRWVVAKQTLTLHVKYVTGLKNSLGFNSRYTMPINVRDRMG
ncbi:alpha carbonic anhydrase [Thamnocephalis sphaerospora]|uniref:Carbonic anhydrase n=1 Tax=Thamnocephalis sphaerospora TaxID=78915 RepID=A0A4P9XIC7_9FUNG|nr:alpha carbonic anhydrase [Thamnocephalis sphaerospora]|eukprot:RKP05438.1 alpha carbonic anhydrase [Thamnocephalis sphaerospora]